MNPTEAGLRAHLILEWMRANPNLPAEMFIKALELEIRSAFREGMKAGREWVEEKVA